MRNHIHGGDESCILLIDCVWRPIFVLIVVNCSKIVFLLLVGLVVRGLWRILLDTWLGKFLILNMYLSIRLWRLSSRGSSPALHKMLSTGLVLKAPVAKRILWLCIGLMMLSTLFFCGIVNYSTTIDYRENERFVDSEKAFGLRSPCLVTEYFNDFHSW
jgi:hypothetical protein